MGPFADFGLIARLVWAFVANTWWLWLPVALGGLGWYLWLLYLKVRYWALLRWVLLEIRIPRDVRKTPEAMEQIFAGLQTMFFGFDPIEQYWLGLQHDYIVFELASMGGETRFYIRVPVFFRNVVEAQVYAQYPESEIAEVEDYVQQLPDQIPSQEWDLWGIEFVFEKEDAYPIRTYRDVLALAPGTEEVEKVDPFSTILELFGKLQPGEHAGYHLLIRPVQNNKWKNDGEELVSKLIGRKLPKEKGLFDELWELLKPLVTGWSEPLRPLFGLGPVPPAAAAKKEERAEEVGTSLLQHLSPGARDIVAAIERNILKPGFEVVIRFCYVARHERYHLSHYSAFVSSLKQYNTQTMNAFKPSSEALARKTTWWWPGPLKRRRKAYKQWLFWRYYRSRKPFVDTLYLKSKPIILNAEELATIYHYPTLTAKAPLMPRIEARRAEPPATLPVG